MKLPKILILGFGGTIAMVEKDNVLRPAKSIEEILNSVPALREKAEVTLEELENLDSTNLNQSHWNRLSIRIAEVQENYDAIIVTHGTDTMAYTAGAVALALGSGLQIPVIFTGSQLPLVAFGSDARFNLETTMKAAHAAIDNQITEVMICFFDRVMRATRAIKISEGKFPAFDSPAFPHLAYVDAEGVNFQPHCIVTDKMVEGYVPQKLDLKPHFSGGIFTADLVPGQEPGMLRALLESGMCRGLLLRSLGAGNVPSYKEYSIIPVIEEAIARKIPVLVSTKFVGGRTHMDTYEPGKLALDAGAIPTRDMTDVMSQVKFMWAIAQGFVERNDLIRILHTSIAGEISSS